MIRRIRRPKMLFNKRFSLKNKIYNTIILKNCDYENMLKLKNNIKSLKDENNIIHNELIALKESLGNLKESLGYNEFIQNIEKANDNKSTALTVVKNNTLLNINSKTKKIAKFSLKSVLISLVISFINLFI